MNVFQPQGQIMSFTAATAAPTSVQSNTAQVGMIAQRQFILTNTDQNNDAVIGWGVTDAIAKLAAAGTVADCYYLLARSQVVISAAPGSFFSGITAANTAVIKVQSGTGA